MSDKIRVSAVLSIHNRSKLFRRAVDGYLWQSLPPENWEIVLVDDMSDEDLSLSYKHAVGRINIRHVFMDHTRHAIWKARNPDWQPGKKEDWFHTPALSTNLGVWLARGRTICLCHPEILHHPDNFRIADEMLAAQQSFLFGLTYLGTPAVNAILDSHPDWTAGGWPGFVRRVNLTALERYGYEKYWYTSFLPKEAACAVGGVSFAYLGGVAGEDDDFKQRVRRAGWPDIHTEAIKGLHQDHSRDKDSWTERQRLDPARFEAALNRNRAILYARLGQPRAEFGPVPCGPGFPIPDNVDYDWTAKECLVRIREHRIGGEILEQGPIAAERTS